MTPTPTVDWDAVIADPRFHELHRRKQVFLSSLMIFSTLYYFLLPVGAAYYQSLFRFRVWGVLNVGLLFALSQFLIAWLLAYYYERRASQTFDALAAEIAAAHLQSGS